MRFFYKKQLKRTSKVLCFIMMFQILFLNTEITFATTDALSNEGIHISYSINGKLNIGNTIEILVNVSNVTDLYGSSIDLVYDPSLIKIQSVEYGSIYGDNYVQVPVNINEDGHVNLVTMLKGSQKGISESGTIAKIKAEILSQGVLKLKTISDNGPLSLDGNTSRVKLSNSNGEKISYSVTDEYIQLLNPEPLVPGTYEEDNVNIIHTGSWVSEKHELYSGREGIYSKASGNTIEFTIDGTAFELYAPTSRERGKANVYIDGKLDSVMDQYSSTFQENNLVFSRYGLAAGEHKIKIETIEETNSNAIDSTIVFDRIDVGNNPLPFGILNPGSYEETNGNIALKGEWKLEKNSLYSENTGKYSRTEGNTIEFTIDGTAFELYAPTNRERGKANVYIDGKLDSVMDQYSTTFQKNNLVFSRYGLSPGKHNIKIQTIAERNSKATDSIIVFDRVEVGNNSLPFGVLSSGSYEETNPNIALKGSWNLEKHYLYSENTGKYSKSKGNTIEFTIDGTAFELYAPTNRDRGKANVYIDGKLDSVMDQYSSTFIENNLVYSRYGLAPGKHNIKIETIEEINSKAIDSIVVFDRIDVGNNALPFGVLKPGSYEETNPNIALKGSWNLEKHSLYSENTGKYSTTKGNTIEFTIEGSTFELYAPTSRARGKANVYIDGKLDSVMDQYSSTFIENNLVYSKYGLAPGKHNIKIETISETNTKATDSIIVIDRVDVGNNTLPVGVLKAGIYEETNPNIALKGSWNLEKHTLYSENTGKYSKTKGDTIEFTIEGTAFELYAPTNRERGKANIYIDGKLDSVMDQYSSTFIEDNLVFSKYGLAPGKHNIKIETIEEKNSNSTDSIIVFDRMKVSNEDMPSGVLKVGTYEETNPNIALKGSWNLEKHTLYSENTGKYSKTKGDTIEFTMEGTGFELYGPATRDRGKANIYIDGKLVSTMDQYSSVVEKDKLLYVQKGLKKGNHVVKIETIAEKNNNAASPFIVFDKLIIK